MAVSARGRTSRPWSKARAIPETCRGFIDPVTGFGDAGECIGLWETREVGESVWQVFDAAPENGALLAAIAETTSSVAYLELVQEGWES